jgi:hypothetical protein
VRDNTNHQKERKTMKSFKGTSMTILAVATLLLAVATGQFVSAENDPHRDHWVTEITDDDTWQQALTKMSKSKSVIELSDASIIIEVNSTDGDAGFQVFVDGEGWRNVRVFQPNGQQVFSATTWSGIRGIGGGTELFLESEEPEYEDLDDFEDLINLLPEGEYMFLARTTGNEWATGTAELTHTVPAGPELLEPVPEGEEECATDVDPGGAMISWMPVEETILGDPDIEIEEYQIIVEDEEAGVEFSMNVGADTDSIVVPAEFLQPATEYKYEVLAIEESGNQTISEVCFETAE